MRDLLLQWLDAGAPEQRFNMNWGLATLTHTDFFDPTDPEPECGTVCCIAGFVAHQGGLQPHEDESAPWDEIRSLALKALDLPSLTPGFGHPLFDPDLAPNLCTPRQAAIAARFAFTNPNHPNPWEALNAASETGQ